MPRKQLIRSHILPYHVTSRSNNKKWFSLPLEQVWKICTDSLKEAHEKHNVEIISFVLMSNHYHMIVRTPEGNLDLFMYEFNKRVAQKLKVSSENINHILGGRYKWCLIQSQKYLGNCYRYVYQNPRRALITDRCENYPYSTLHCIVYNKKFVVPLFDQMGFKDPFMLNRLNAKVDEEEILALKKSLYRSELTELKIRKKRTAL
jgi:putative transposase